jgi:hypothetical protein
MSDTERWNAFVAAVAASPTGFPAAPTLVLPDGNTMDVARLIRDVVARELDLPDERWDALADAGFPWAGIEAGTVPLPHAGRGHRPPPVSTKHSDLTDATQRDVRLVMNGQITLDRLIALAASPHPVMDVMAVWMERGMQILTGAHETIPHATSEPDLVVNVDGTAFALGTWAVQARRAAAQGLLTEVNARLATPMHKHHLLTLQNFGLFEQYAVENPGLAVPNSHLVSLADGTVYNLGRWIESAVERKNRNVEVEVALEALGMPPAAQRTRTARMFNEHLATLRWFREAFPDRDVERNTIVERPGHEPFNLGRWVNKHRTKMLRGELSVEHRAALESLGISTTYKWDVEFQRGLDAFDDFVRRHRHGNVGVRAVVTGRDGKPVKLGSWCLHQRAQYRNNQLDPERVALLEDHGFVWNAKEAVFTEALRVLDTFIAREGIDAVAQMHHRHVERLDDGTEYPLGQFLHRRRQSIRTGEIRGERLEALRARGVTYQPDNPTPTRALEREPRHD